MEESTESTIPCSICLEPMEEHDNECVVLPCIHGFHKNCIATWMKKSNTCPLCKASIPPHHYLFPVLNVITVQPVFEEINTYEAWRRQHEQEMQDFYAKFIQVYMKLFTFELFLSSVMAIFVSIVFTLLTYCSETPFNGFVGIVSVFLHVVSTFLHFAYRQSRFACFSTWKRYMVSLALRKGIWSDATLFVMERMFRLMAEATTVYFYVVVHTHFSLPWYCFLFFHLLYIVPIVALAYANHVFLWWYQDAHFWKSFLYNDQSREHLTRWHQELSQ